MSEAGYRQHKQAQLYFEELRLKKKLDRLQLPGRGDATPANKHLILSPVFNPRRSPQKFNKTQ
jgi:hypothetical protein